MDRKKDMEHKSKTVCGKENSPVSGKKDKDSKKNAEKDMDYVMPNEGSCSPEFPEGCIDGDGDGNGQHG